MLPNGVDITWLKREIRVKICRHILTWKSPVESRYVDTTWLEFPFWVKICRHILTQVKNVDRSWLRTSYIHNTKFSSSYVYLHTVIEQSPVPWKKIDAWKKNTASNLYLLKQSRFNFCLYIDQQHLVSPFIYVVHLAFFSFQSRDFFLVGSNFLLKWWSIFTSL